jgi:hypothetical protein
MAATVNKLLTKLRALCKQLPEVTDEPFGSHFTFRAGKKTFMYFLNNHHGDGRIALWCKAPPGAQAMAVEADPERIFIPPYVGPRGWIGVRLDRELDWEIVAAFVRDAYETSAPKKKRVAKKTTARSRAQRK